mgnify:CR=1 FL=1
MQRSTYLSLTNLSVGLLATFALVAPGCDDGPDPAGDQPAAADAGDEPSQPGEDAEPLDPPSSDPGLSLGGIDGEFASAAKEFDVPVQLLQAIGYVETQWQMIAGEEEFAGQDPAFGVMALRGDRLARAAELAGETVADVKTGRRANIRAGAALLSAAADELGVDRSKLGAWAPAVARFSGIADDMIDVQANYVHNDVYAQLRAGKTIVGPDGTPVATMTPIDAIPEFVNPVNPSAAPGPDYAGSVWRASPNYSNRSGGVAGVVKMVIIHSCEGAYSGCWGWLVNQAAGVSAHYVVKEDGSEISQLVKEANKAWHIGATYDCKLNSSKECTLNGYNATLRTTGQGNDSVDAGKLAFSGYSPGYQQTRFDLGALAGQAVRLQFAVSTDSLADQKFLFNFADINLLSELRRVDGVGYADILGNREYAMRIWLKPDRMASLTAARQHRRRCGRGG